MYNLEDKKRWVDMMKLAVSGGIKAGHNDNQIKFTVDLFRAAIYWEKKINIPAEIIFAQGCIEAAYGKTPLEGINGEITNNYYEMKSYNPNEPRAWCATQEEENGVKFNTHDWFKVYENVEENLADYTDLLDRKYRPDMENPTIDDWINSLQGTYATDSGYGDLIKITLRRVGLYD